MTSMKRLLASAALVALVMCAIPRQAEAQATPFVGQVALFAFNFCPTGWLPMNGQLLSISQNTALFSLLGTNYGGDGTTTFGLPKWGPVNSANGFPYTACIATQGVFPSRN
jgi:microcystin-dependent protein